MRPETESAGQADAVSAAPAQEGREVRAEDELLARFGAERIALVDRAIETWKARLIDATRNNPLLYYRPTRTTTLEFDGLTDPAVLSDFLAGKSARLRPVADRVHEDDTYQEQLRQIQKRATTIERKARTHLEEEGLETLHVGLGMVSWPVADGGRPVTAPVLLFPAELKGRGSGTKTFILGRSGDATLNPVLLRALGERGVEVDEDMLLVDIAGVEVGDPDLEGALDPEPIFARLRRHAHTVEGFEISPRAVLANFSYAKMAIYEDLVRHREHLIAHPIVAAVAGDTDSRTALVQEQADPDPRSFDEEPVEAEHLILDADASQRVAIRRVLEGQSGVIQGPPGTGKSQTISNLIAEMVAQGKRVLFVAEKRAALDAVYKRLDRKGLGYLLLDLHDKQSRKDIAARMADAYQNIRAAPDGAGADAIRLLEDKRRRLVEHERRMNQPREPMGRSVFELRSQLAATPPEARVEVEWDEDELAAHVEGREQVEEALRDLAEVSDLFLENSISAWAGARIETGDVEHAIDAARAAHAAHDDVRQAAGSLRLALDGTLARWTEEFPGTVRRALGRPYAHEIQEEDLEGLAEVLDEVGATGAFERMRAYLFDPAYRAVARTLRVHRTRPLWPWSNLQDDLACLARLRKLFAGERVPQSEALRTAASAAEAYRERLERLVEFLPRAWGGGTDILEMEGFHAALTRDVQNAYRVPQMRHAVRRLEELGLHDLVEVLRLDSLPAERWLGAFEHALTATQLRHVAARDSKVIGFDGRTQDEVVRRFQELDRRILDVNALRVRRKHAERVTAVRNEHPEQDATLRHEAAKRSRHLPLRRLLEETPDLLTALFPCWMASPLSVSRLLAGDQTYFDVVIFDEASQIFPEDGVPSILRAESLVVAGDRHQLPPTSFFGAGGNEDEDEEDPAAGFDSLLDNATAFLPAWWLTWHYRSRDERLIAFSNRHIYDDLLVTFPGSGHFGEAIQWELAPHDGADERTDSAAGEVRRVVEMIIEHAEERPEESLGVIAMGVQHQRRIQMALDRVLALRPDLEDFFDPDQPERFFVKNLERVQGDEREAIILSVGYGKRRSGDLPHNFGPITGDVGHRRLNVAVTRARRRMRVISSFSWDEVDLSRAGSRGVRFLKDYLRYAESEGRILGDEGEQNVPLNPFEKDIKDSLDAAGIPLLAQYGSSGYRIDLVACHRERPGRYVLAIECDGASYHAGQTARDRDRLRQSVLEGLGWRFHRIWSTDWFNRKEDEVRRAVEAYEEALVFADRLDGGEEEIAAPARAAEVAVPEPSRGPRPNFRVRETIDDYPFPVLVEVVRWINSDGLLRSDEEVLREAMEILSFSRKGSRIARRIGNAIASVRNS